MKNNKIPEFLKRLQLAAASCSGVELVLIILVIFLWGGFYFGDQASQFVTLLLAVGSVCYIVSLILLIVISGETQTTEEKLDGLNRLHQLKIEAQIDQFVEEEAQEEASLFQAYIAAHPNSWRAKIHRWSKKLQKEEK